MQEEGRTVKEGKPSRYAALCELCAHPEETELCGAVVEGITLPAHHVKHVVRLIELVVDAVQNAMVMRFRGRGRAGGKGRLEAVEDVAVLQATGGYTVG